MTTAVAVPRRVADSGERRRLDDEYLTRREAEAATEAHQAVHESQEQALRTAMDVAERIRLDHNAAHDREHIHHTEKHGTEREAVRVALDAVARERVIHADAHEREHTAHKSEHLGHGTEHDLNNLAITKAEKATDDRFAASNAYREQINDLVRRMVTRDQLDVQTKEHDRRYEEMRRSIIDLEKGDVGDRSLGRGRAIGQGVVIAAIIGVVSFIATVLTIFIGVTSFVRVP